MSSGSSAEKARLKAEFKRKNRKRYQIECKLEKDRLRSALRRYIETPEEKELRKEQSRLRTRKKRSNETLEQYEYRLEGDRIRNREKRKNESPEARERKKAINTEQVRQRRANETPEQKQIKREKDKLRRRHQRQMIKEQQENQLNQVTGNFEQVYLVGDFITDFDKKFGTQSEVDSSTITDLCDEEGESDSTK